MLVAGLTGGMACGKSFVARAFAELGCHVIEADELGHQVLERGGEAYDAVVAEFGPGILDADGRIERSQLAARVFGDPAALERLNRIVHPAVHARALQTIAEVRAREPHAVVIYVAAILIESGGSRIVDKIVVVTCDAATQMERALERPGATGESVQARLKRQMPIEEKKKFADYVIETNGTKEDTLRQTELVFRELRRLAG